MSSTKLSIVIPVRDQPLPLSLTLHWLAKVLPPDSEVIVVDDGSLVSVASLVRRYADRLAIDVIVQERRGRAAARNAGWKAASGDRVLYNDADRLPAMSDLTPHKTGEGIVIGCLMEFYLSKLETVAEALCNDFSQLQPRAREPLYAKMMRTHLFNQQGGARTNIPWAAFITANVSVPRAALVETGGFDEAFRTWGTEHFELGYRLWQHGVPFHYSTAAVNYHIAHSREPGFYQTQITSSLEYFRNKHKDVVLDVFADFFFGQASLQAVEMAASVPGPWVVEYPTPVMFYALQLSQSHTDV